MANNNLDSAVLSNFGGINRNNLNDLMDVETEDNCEYSIKSFSPYKLMEEIPDYLDNVKNDFSIMSLNCQSLNAKFDKIKSLITYLKNNGLNITCICLQETWVKDNKQSSKFPDMSFFRLPGYQEPIAQSASCGEHGGLAIYLIDGLKASIIHSHTNTKNWEGLFIKVTGTFLSKPVVIGNIYRPPRDNNQNRNIEIFISEFKPVIDKISKRKCDVMITGDTNIDLLQINHREKYAEFFLFITNKWIFPTNNVPDQIC